MEKKKIQVVYKKTKDLIPYINNPRINDAGVEALMNSIEKFGFKAPIVVDRDNEIIAGHTRLKAAKELGLEEVPCIIADDLTEEEAKAFRIADNKVAELSDWDFELLESELQELEEFDFDFEEFGFDFEDFGMDANQNLFNKENEEKFSLDEPIENQKNIYIKNGDLIELGEHRLLCGDSSKKENYERLMSGEKADIIVTDPPYNVGYIGGTKKRQNISNDNMEDEHFVNFLRGVFEKCYENIKQGGVIYVFYAQAKGEFFKRAYREAGFKLAEVLIWVKQNATFGRQDYHWMHEPILYGWKEGKAHKWKSDRKQNTVINPALKLENLEKNELIQIIKELDTNVIYHDRPKKSDLHPTTKPISLVAYLIGNNSDKGEIVLEPFMGSGSTLMASEELGRVCYGIEIEPMYCQIVIDRYKEAYPKEVIKINGVEL